MIKDSLSIKVTPATESKISQVDWSDIPFGRIFTDHMLVMDYKDGSWQKPEIVPFGPLDLHPATSALHYGQSIFEGMKAYKTESGEVVIFRPDMNADRFAESSERMCMPMIEPEMFVELVRRFTDVERDWIPAKDGYSLYLRPFLFATDEFVGIRPSENYKFVIFACPVGAYYSTPVNVKIEEYYTRASVGGVGRAKTAGNYAASLYPAKLGAEKGFHQLVWTDGVEHKYIEESGTMNIVFMIDDILISPSEESDTILRGVTKRSVLDLAHAWGVRVEERKISVEEVINAIRENRLSEAFGAGTAATIAQIAKIGFRDELFTLPAVETRKFSARVKKYLDDLKAGKVADEFNWLLHV